MIVLNDRLGRTLWAVQAVKDARPPRAGESGDAALVAAEKRSLQKQSLSGAKALTSGGRP